MIKLQERSRKIKIRKDNELGRECFRKIELQKGKASER
jgi:hypothetical protein